MRLFVQFTWGIIQTLVGQVFLAYMKRKKLVRISVRFPESTVHYLSTPRMWGVSLGAHVFLHSQFTQALPHERGHAIQSMILGPLYLPIIGLPSIITARFLPNKHKSMPYEVWADKLGATL